jgi:hypothetical protein
VLWLKTTYSRERVNSMPRNIDIEKVKNFLKEKEDRRRKALQERWAAA